MQSGTEVLRHQNGGQHEPIRYGYVILYVISYVILSINIRCNSRKLYEFMDRVLVMPRDKVTPSQGLSWYLKWAGTFCILFGAACTAWNIIPLNLILSTLGGALWLTVGILWSDRSLILLNFFVGGIYFIGLMRHVFIGA